MYLHGVGPVGDLGIHGPLQRDKFLSVEPVHDNNDKAVVDQGSGPNLSRKEAVFKENHVVRNPKPELTITSPYLIVDSKVQLSSQRQQMPTNVSPII